MDDDGSCADGTFDARYGYDLDGNRLWARLHDGQSETVVVQIEGLADCTRGSNDAQIHVVAFGRRVATKYLESAVVLAAPTYVPGTKVPLEPGWLLLAVAFAGGLWLLVIAVRDGVPSRMAERPAAATVVILVSGLLIAPPPAWAGGGGGGGGPQVYRRWLFHDHLGTNVLVTNVNGAVIRRRLFEPFGRLLDQQSSTEPHDRLFTGQRYEESTRLYDFQQRWYDAETGRFTGVDPVVQSPGDPQMVNPYGYVRNNPARFLDPDGQFIAFGGLGAALNAGAAFLGSGERPTAKELSLASQPGGNQAIYNPKLYYTGAPLGIRVKAGELASGVGSIDLSDVSASLKSLLAHGGAQLPQLAGGNANVEAQALQQAQELREQTEVGIGPTGLANPSGSSAGSLPLGGSNTGRPSGVRGVLVRGFAVGGPLGLEEAGFPILVLGAGATNILLGWGLLAGLIVGGPVGGGLWIAGLALIGTGALELDMGVAAMNEHWGTNARVGPFPLTGALGRSKP